MTCKGRASSILAPGTNLKLKGYDNNIFRYRWCANNN